MSWSLRRSGLAALAVTAATLSMTAGGSALAAAPQTADVVSTVAGGVGGPGPATTIGQTPCGVGFSSGTLYVDSSTSVRAVSQQTGQLTTPAGDGSPNPPGNGGVATRAGMATCSSAVDAHGNLLVADSGHEQIRVVAHSSGTFYGRAMTAGHIYAIAGTGKRGFTGDGGPAVSATFESPSSVGLDAVGNLVIADTNNQRIRVVAEQTGTFYGQAMTAGDVYTVAGTGGYGFSGDGGPATGATFEAPSGVTVDGAGNLVIADTYDERVRVVAEQAGTFYGVAMTAGNIYTVAGNSQIGHTGDGGPATSALLAVPEGVAIDSTGNLLIADTFNDRIQVVAARQGTFYGQAMQAGYIYTVAGTGQPGFSGDGHPATSAKLSYPSGVTTDSAGDLLIADSQNGRVRLVAESAGTRYGRALTVGDIYTVSGNADCCYSGDGGPSLQAQFDQPQGVAADAAGNVVISDTDNFRIRVAARATGTFYGLAMTTGHVYTVAGTGVAAYSGDGGPATSAAISYAEGVAVDAAGNLVIADTYNDRIRVLAATSGTFYGQAMTAGYIYTVAGSGSDQLGDGGPATSAGLSFPEGVAIDAAGNLVIADSVDNRIRVVATHTGTYYQQAMTAGDIYTVAGSGKAGFFGDGDRAVKAGLTPSTVAVDSYGNLIISDGRHWRVRVVAEQAGTFYGVAMTVGRIYTVVGDGGYGFAGDGGPATGAEFRGPTAVTVDSQGNLVIADTANDRVRVVPDVTGTYYGQAMQAGFIYTVLGTGVVGWSGDGGPGTSAEVDRPGRVAPDGPNLLIADSDNGRVRDLAG